MTNPKLSPTAQEVLDAYIYVDCGTPSEAQIAAALKALGILAYEICDGPSFRLVVDFDDILAIAKELENQ